MNKSRSPRVDHRKNPNDVVLYIFFTFVLFCRLRIFGIVCRVTIEGRFWMADCNGIQMSVGPLPKHECASYFSRKKKRRANAMCPPLVERSFNVCHRLLRVGSNVPGKHK
eukprot:GEMP01096465.1.p1 GENE.GEMP01096465.1~~GEMP01096465.1.p1  ORF type:complete len:110 (-),score=0.49 GEMP01096465.1:193-522(-)